MPQSLTARNASRRTQMRSQSPIGRIPGADVGLRVCMTVAHDQRAIRTPFSGLIHEAAGMVNLLRILVFINA